MARVLIVEDHPANLELLRYLLEASGHTTACACDGAEGLAAARLSPPDLVLCDLRMPRMDGYTFAREMRADPRLRSIVIVAVTAYSMPGDRERTIQLGFDGYITKPVDPEKVVGQMEAFLAAGTRFAQA